MAEPVKKTKVTAKPRQASTKNDEVAEAVKTAPTSREQVEQSEKAETPKKTKATATPGKAAAKRDNVTSIAKPASLSRERIEQLAYEFWAQRGYHHGQALQDWLRAERELLQKAS